MQAGPATQGLEVEFGNRVFQIRNNELKIMGPVGPPFNFITIAQLWLPRGKL